MPVIGQLNSANISLPAGQSLSVSADLGSAGAIMRNDPGYPGSIVVASGTTKTIGPFPANRAYAIVCTSGSLSYSIGIDDAREGDADATYASLAGSFGGMARRGPVLFDDFDIYGPQLLVGRMSPQGNVWQSSGAGAASVSVTNGKMTAQANCYNYLPPLSSNPSGVTRQACRFSFTPVASTNGNRANAKVVLLAVPNAGNINGKLLHLQITADGWNMQASNSGPSGLGGGFGAGNWKVPLLTDGTPYEVAVEYDYTAHTYTIYGPDGSIISGTHNAIGASWTDFNTPGVTGTIGPNDVPVPCWQIVGDTLSYNVFYHQVSAGPVVSDRGRLAPMGAVASLYGYGFTQRIPFDVTLTGGGNAWFRLVTAQVIGISGLATEYTLAGRLRFEAMPVTTQAGQAAYQNGWDFLVNSVESGAFAIPSPTLTHKQGIQINAAAAITQARISVDPNFGGPNNALDVFLNASVTDPVRLRGEFMGYGSVSQVPARNVTALNGADATKLATLAFSAT